jgi:hypothetical protein
MDNEIISYLEMCRREGTSLQRGMNFRLNPNYSVILMSTRANSPYQDRVESNGAILIYERHDVPRGKKYSNPKFVDQPEQTPTGISTENGKFFLAANEFCQGRRVAEPVKVYEKIRSGIWSYNGLFQLIGAWKESDGHRSVFKFKLEAIEDEAGMIQGVGSIKSVGRIIPTSVKLEVWKRDGGKCVTCGATDELHFDHIIPFSKGGTSLKAENIQLLCARHNLEKRDRIE